MKKVSIDKKFDINKIIIIILVIIIVYIVYDKVIKEQFNREQFNDYFDCYLKLVDINPQFVNQYMKFDDKHVSTGRCTDARLHVTVEPCATDSNGIPSSSCMETATLSSSKGNPLEFPYIVSPENMTKFFGIKV